MFSDYLFFSAISLVFNLSPSLSAAEARLTRGDMAARTRATRSRAFGISVKNRRLITSWNNLMSGLVWAPLSRTAEQAQPSAGRFISVSLDKPAGHHGAGTHILFLGKKKKRRRQKKKRKYPAWWSCPVLPRLGKDRRPKWTRAFITAPFFST